MNVAERVTHPDDIAYVREHFMPLSQHEPFRPEPSYVVGDGTPFVPADYFEYETDRDRFIARFIEQAAALALPDPQLLAAQAWEEFMTGIYGVCLRRATPENIARKTAIIGEIDILLAHPRPRDRKWLYVLKNAVDALDELEMPFSPVYDRERFGRPPTRDTHIRDVRERFLS
jgi:hypothetical protein